MIISGADARNAEIEASRQRQRFAKLLRGDESKAPTASDVLRIRRLLAAAADGNGYDAMLAESTCNVLFDCGALYFAPTER